jgi:SAM-dependent methyltransferase
MRGGAYRQFLELERDHFWFRGRRRIFADVLADALRGSRAERLLDLGCGVGGMLALLGAHGRVFGVEPWHEGAVHCRQRGFPAVAVADATALPFADASFDVITMFDVLQHVEEDREALREARRLLREGGVLIVTGPAYQWLWSNNDVVVRHRRRYTRPRLRRVLDAAGFAGARISYFNTLLFPAIALSVLALKLKRRIAGGAPDETNLSVPMPRAVHAGLAAIMASERHLLRWMNLPFGHSLLAVARR